MWRLNAITLALAFVAAVASVWWIDTDPRDPKPDPTLETAAARRARLDALLDREVRLEFENEPAGPLIRRLCQSAGVAVRILHDDAELEELAAEERPHLRNPTALKLPHPLRLRSALALATPSCTAAFVGEELQVCSRSSKQRPPTALRVRPLPFAPSDLTALLPYDALSGPTELDSEPEPEQVEDPFGSFLRRVRQVSTPNQIVVWAAPEPSTSVDQFVESLEAATAERLTEPALIGESVAGRASRRKVEAEWERIVTLSLDQASLEEAAASIQAQLSVNLYLDPWNPYPVNASVDPAQRITLHGRAPASVAVAVILEKQFILGQRYDAQLLHDVILLSIRSPAYRLWMYPTGRLDRASLAELAQDTLLRSLTVVNSNRPHTFLDQALTLHQTAHSHAELSKSLQLLNQGQHPDLRSARPDPVQQALNQPARPIPGPLDLGELVRRLNAEHQICVLAYEPHTAGEANVALAGDAGGGTVEAQLKRMLKGAAGVSVNEGVLLLSTDSVGTGWSQQLYRTARLDPAQIPPWQVAIANDAPHLEIVEVLHKLRGVPKTWFDRERRQTLESHVSVPGGTVVWAQPSFQQLASRLLSSGHPFHETWLLYVYGPRAEREQVLARSLANADPYVSGLGVWLLRQESVNLQLALRPQLAPVFRSGVHFEHEFQESSLAEDLWCMVSALPSEGDLPELLEAVGGRAPIEKPLMNVLRWAAAHRRPEVGQAAFTQIARLPARTRREGACHIKPEVFLAGLGRKDLVDDVVRTSIEAHADYWFAQDRLGQGWDWFMALHDHAPYLKDRLKSALMENPIRTREDWRTDAGDAYVIYLEMLDDDEPEQRRTAYRALRQYPHRDGVLRDRLRLQREDPATADLAPPLPEYQE